MLVYDELDHILHLVSYANDECDPGMGLELGLQLMARSVSNKLDKDIVRLLQLGYQLTDRLLYSSIIEQHLSHRIKLK